MFLSRMVSGFLNSNKNQQNSNINQPPSSTQSTAQHSSQNSSNNLPKKSHKRSDKRRRPKPKKAITELLKPIGKNASGNDEEPQTSKEIFSPGTNKVKSASWKRSDRSATFVNKKNKVSRKHSPNWLKINCVAGKGGEYQVNKTQDSACRPGTLYSDVVLGGSAAGVSSNLGNMRTLTPPPPRRLGNGHPGDNAQKKLTEALMKFSLEEQSDSNDESCGEIMDSQNVGMFPSLHKMLSKETASHQAVGNSLACEGGTNTELNCESPSSSKDNSTKSYEEADVVILSDHKENSRVDGQPQVSYGNYLEKQFEESAVQSSSTIRSAFPPEKPQKLMLNIPYWNFTEPDFSPLGYPKFVCQFEDENYLKAEKLAMLSLNLAMGNRAEAGKFKL
ncbi:uncharacterized protein [Musca autumnalis]|uniref:uncharacterized protein n=1 Tax=Musca autumnalis TaxID=221902 RepID=UPI003CF81AB4